MKLSDLSIHTIVDIILGDNAPSPRMTGSEIIKFFNIYGIRDVYDSSNGGLPNALSRKQYTLNILKSLNNLPILKLLVEGLVDSRRVKNEDEIAEAINLIIKHDGYSLEKNSDQIYKITGCDITDQIEVKAHFEEIRKEIIDHIKEANFMIWVAMAWFTDKYLAKELWLKHQAGINIQVIVNNDEITLKNGRDFSKVGIEYYKVSPDSEFGKKIMHNKFCVIDLKKVIHGSYNWTNNAVYNKENITVTESRELAEDFSQQFIDLKKNAIKNG